MGYIAPILAYTCSLGYLRCTECASPDNSIHPVHADNSAHNTEACDICHKPIRKES